MIVYITDKQGKVIFSASNKAFDDQLIMSDSLTDTIDTGIKTFEVQLKRTDTTRNVLKAGNFMLYKSDVDELCELFTITDVKYESSDNTVTAYGEGAGLDLINSYADAWSADKSKNIMECIKQTMGDDFMGWTIRNNIDETVTKTKDNFVYTSEETVTSRLLSILTIFDAEMYFSYEIKGLKVVDRIINIVEKRGVKEPVKSFRLDTEISKITESHNINNLSTAFIVSGVNKKGKVTKLSGLTDYSKYKDKTFASDDKEFPTKRKHTYKIEGDYVKCVEGMQLWSSSFRPDGVFERKVSTEYKTAKEAIEYAIREIEKVVEGTRSYDIEFIGIQNGINVGDFINIIDANDELYLKSRIAEITRSEIGNSLRVTLSDTETISVAKLPTSDFSSFEMYSLDIISSNGLNFRTATDTVLEVILQINGVNISWEEFPEDLRLQWYEDDIPIGSDDARLGNNGFTLSIRVDNPSVNYRCELEEVE